MRTLNFKTALVITVGLFSCTKVIQVDLNSANPNIVVDAQLSDQPGPYKVNLTKTVNFSDDNIFPTVSEALVTLSDDTGNSETLSESSPGNYISVNMQGVVGRTYNLTIYANEKTYSAVSTMAAPVVLDSLVADTSKNNGGFFGGNNNGKGISIRVVFTDPKGTTNYYRLIKYVNHVPDHDIVVISDKSRDGEVFTSNVARRDTSIHKGDTVNVALESIDKNAYEYFRTLDQLTSAQGGLQSASPGNPASNISNKALGFFSAHSVRFKSIVIH